MDSSCILNNFSSNEIITIIVLMLIVIFMIIILMELHRKKDKIIGRDNLVLVFSIMIMLLSLITIGYYVYNNLLTNNLIC